MWPHMRDKEREREREREGSFKAKHRVEPKLTSSNDKSLFDSLYLSNCVYFRSGDFTLVAEFSRAFCCNAIENLPISSLNPHIFVVIVVIVVR